MTDKLKGFEPVGTVDSHYVEYNGDYTYAIWADEDSPPKKGTKLYTADQLAQVVQQRDELLAALKCAESLFDRKWNSVVGSGCEFHWQPVGNWRHYTCKMTGETFVEAIAKVQS